MKIILYITIGSVILSGSLLFANTQDYDFKNHIMQITEKCHMEKKQYMDSIQAEYSDKPLLIQNMLGPIHLADTFIYEMIKIRQFLDIYYMVRKDKDIKKAILKYLTGSYNTLQQIVNQANYLIPNYKDQLQKYYANSVKTEIEDFALRLKQLTESMQAD